MNRKKKDRMNLLFSAFLVTAFMVCASFFTGMIHDSFAQNFTAHTLLLSLIFLLFGLLLFYATRVGDGRQMVRFSPATLIVMVLPALYVILSTVISGLPFHDVLSARPEAAQIAAVVLGYGIPYTFLSGYELDRSEIENAAVSDAMQENADSSAVTSPENKTSDSNNEENTIDESDD